MTFSVVARRSATGELAVGSATSDIAVGARVPWLRAGVGAVATQHTTDPRLGIRALDLMATGASAEEALAAVVASTSLARARQLAVVAPTGALATYSGALVDRAAAAELRGADAAVVGNVLASPAVGDAILAAFEACGADVPLAEAVVRALEAGLAAGGEQYPLRSASLVLVDDQPFPAVDLRVDDHDEPLTALRALWGAYAPRRADFRARALSPDLSYAE